MLNTEKRTEIRMDLKEFDLTKPTNPQKFMYRNKQKAPCDLNIN